MADCPGELNIERKVQLHADGRVFGLTSWVTCDLPDRLPLAELVAKMRRVDDRWDNQRARAHSVAVRKNTTKRHQPIQPRQQKFAQGLMAGKTKVRAALDAGYSESYAYKSSFALIERPQVKTFLTEAFLAKGLTPEKIIQPVLDGYEAKVKVFNRRVGSFIVTDEPDHDIRLKA